MCHCERIGAGTFNRRLQAVGIVEMEGVDEGPVLDGAAGAYYEAGSRSRILDLYDDGW